MPAQSDWRNCQKCQGLFFNGFQTKGVCPKGGQHEQHDPNTAFNFSVSIEAALVSIVGGVGTLWGPVIGTVLLEATSALLQSWLGSSTGGVQLTVYSLILMAVILWRPTGIMGFITETYQRRVRARGGTVKAVLDG